MAPDPNKLTQFWTDLKRRRVIRVIPVYAAAAFIILELADILAEPLRLPDWSVNFVLILLCIGFIIYVILSWVYDVTPEGIQKTKPSSQLKSNELQPATKGWKIATFVSVLIIIAFVVFYIVGNNKKSFDIFKLEKSIAVLPFENMSDDDEFAHLGDAITDEIIMQLYKINEFEVRSRTSIMQYKNTGKTSPVIGEELKVNYILEGSTQRYEDQVRIRIQLIQASTDDHIWGDTFEGEWKDIFNIQINVAKQVALELKTALSPKEIEKIEKKPTENLEAYNLYLKGRFFWYRRTEIDLKKSINYFEQALRKDTTYALAHAGLADAYFIMPWYSSYPRIDAYIKANKYAKKAISIDENIVEAHATLGELAIWHKHNWKLAEEELKLAIRLNPNYDVAHQYYFELLFILGRSKEAEVQINLAIKYNPNFVVYLNQRARFYYEEGRYLEAINEYKQVLEIKYWQSSMINIIKCYLKLGKDEELIEQVKAIATRYDSDNHNKLLDELYETSGIEGIIFWFIDWLILYEPTQLRTIASFYAIVGNNQKAFEYLEKFIDGDKPGRLFINTYSDFKSLKTDPRYIAMLKEMNLK